MPIWISQETVTADTPRNHSRTAWLDPLQRRIQDAIRAYVQANPGGETVTLAVFDQIPPAAVEKLLPKGRTLDAGRRELGLRVPLELIGMYGASRVETLRRDNGRTASPRRTGRDWPRNFTPHRVTVAAAGDRTDREVAFGPDFPQPAAFSAIFDGWLSVLGRYRKAGADLGWWHNEQANVSLLAGAIWRLEGAACIGELPVPRSYGSQDGRGDLWLSIGGHDAWLEAKIAWPTHAEQATRQLERRLADAAEQLEAIPTDSARYAACFVVPMLRTGATVAEAESVLAAAWDAIRKQRPASAMARMLAWDDPLALTASDGFVYPGVMLVVAAV